MPERESIESFAAHQASMAVYLSAGMVKELSKRLIDGGYAPDTPAAIVYKATWPDEEAYVCTVETLAAGGGGASDYEDGADSGGRCAGSAGV